MQLTTLATVLLATSVSLGSAFEFPGFGGHNDGRGGHNEGRGGHNDDRGHKGHKGHKGDHGNHGGHPVTTKTPVAPGTSFHWSNSSAAEVPTTFESTTIISTSEVIPTTSSFIPSTSEIPSTTSASPSPSSSAIDYRIPLYGQCYKEGSYYPYSCIDGAHCRVDSYWYGQCVFDGQLYNQCGGIAFRGKKSCDTGLTCSYLNDYYHQCLIPTTYAYTYI